ncbi:MAG: FkbM family methyltransferase [Alphaproteobacteria bacterium]|nr:FkbM family methyltransferase [Alphaproteobacteria bacterium]
MELFGLFKNKAISFAVTVAFTLFVIVLFLEKTKFIFRMTPKLRGEVDVSAFVITTLKDGSPIMVKRDDPNVGEQLRLSGTVRSKFNSVISAFYNDNLVVVEVGPNFGYNTIPLAKGLRNEGKVYAFEANSKVCSALKKSLVLNDIEDKVSIKNIAISDHKGSCDIPDCTSVVAFADGTYSEPRIFTAECSTLDEEMINEDRAVDLIAVDIPDMEIPILRSCESIIDKSPDIVVVSTFDNDPVDPNALIEFTKLENKGMKFYIATEKDKYTQVTTEELLKKKQVILLITRKDLPT